MRSVGIMFSYNTERVKECVSTVVSISVDRLQIINKPWLVFKSSRLQIMHVFEGLLEFKNHFNEIIGISLIRNILN